MPLDSNRTAELNDRFKKLRSAARKIRQKMDAGKRRKQQMATWRDLSTRKSNMSHLIAKRRAELKARQEQALKDKLSTREQRFAANRAKQLETWRTRVASVSDGS